MTTAKPESETTAKRAAAALKEKELQTAYEVHTLAQMVYNQIAVTNPQRTPMPTSAWSPSSNWMPTMAAGAPPWSVPTGWPW